MPSKCAQCGVRPVFGGTKICSGCEYNNTEINPVQSGASSRCAAEGCRRFCVVGGGKFCSVHTPAEDDHTVAGPMDCDPQWHTVDKISATPTQSKSILIARTVGLHFLYLLSDP
mgnify:CR=1 FL=1